MTRPPVSRALFVLVALLPGMAVDGHAAAVSLRQQAEGLNAAIGAFQLAQEG